MEHKFCKDCKFFHEFFCLYPSKFDIVTGEIEPKTTYAERSVHGDCEPEGKHWKKREKPWWRFW